MNTWFRLPSADWAGTLLTLSLGVVSAAAAIYSSAVLTWIAELEAATRATADDDGVRLDPRAAVGRRARRRLQDVKARDPLRTLGRLSLTIATPMTALGLVAGLQIPDTGLVYTVIPVLLAAGVAVGTAFLPGRAARAAADVALSELRPARTPVGPPS